MDRSLCAIIEGPLEGLVGRAAARRADHDRTPYQASFFLPGGRGRDDWHERPQFAGAVRRWLMLLLAKHACRAKVQASDGKVGNLIDLLFDDQKWSVVRLVLSGGTWLNRRRVTLPTDIIEDKDWADRRVSVTGLTRQQIIDSRGVETHVSLSVHGKPEEAAIMDWEVYWISVGETGQPWKVSKDPHLRSIQEVIGYCIQANDGGIGHVADFLIDDETWAIHDLVVDTRTWWPGKHVLIAPVQVQGIDGYNRAVRVAISREEIRSSPRYEPLLAHKDDDSATPGEHGVLRA
jgi:hypothetical protein